MYVPFQLLIITLRPLTVLCDDEGNQTNRFVAFILKVIALSFSKFTCIHVCKRMLVVQNRHGLFTEVRG